MGDMREVQKNMAERKENAQNKLCAIIPTGQEGMAVQESWS